MSPIFDLPRGAHLLGGGAALGAVGLSAANTGPANAPAPEPVRAPPPPAHVRTADSLGIRTGLPSWIRLPAPPSGGGTALSVRAATAAAERTEEVATAREIRHAERILAKAGFRPGDVDGRATPAFARALSQFQSALGLEVTGTLDVRTTRALDRVFERMRKHGDTLGVGQAGGAVKTLQSRLRRLGYSPETDGVYGQRTAAAVRAFRGDQKELTNGSTTATPKVRQSLRAEVDGLSHAPYHSRVKNTAAHRRMERATMRAVSRRDGVGRGAEGRVVDYIQQHLRSAGYDPQLPSRGRFDERTEGMVKIFQRKVDLPVTGVVDRATWLQLRKAKMEAKSSVDPAQRAGERSNAVRATEKRLRYLGYSPGKVDRVYTAATQRAVDRFRAEEGLGHRGSGVTARVDKELRKEVRKKKNRLHGSPTTGYVNGVPRRIQVVSIEGHLVEIRTARAYLKMKRAAARDGVQLRINSGFRTMAEQTRLWNCWQARVPGCNPAAPPGFSNHQSGIALDLNTQGVSQSVGNGTVYNWLARNAARFGFSRIPIEHWHWEYRR